MAFLEQKLHIKVAQKQVLTPSLMQLVRVLALNKVELSEVISQELMENRVLEQMVEAEESGDEGKVKEERASDLADKEIINVTTSENGESSDSFDQID